MTKQLLLDVHHKLIVDLFAGGGGMSTAFEMAFGRSPDIAINHDEDALSMHRANHPQTRHFIADVYEVCPRGATQGRPIGWLHASPDCTHHSQAAGGQPRSKKIRGLAWVAYRWAGQVQPDVISLENVKQIRQWGPLIAKRCKTTGRVLKLDGTVADPGERVPVQEQYLIPDPKRAGQTWNRFMRAMEKLGYVGETQLMVAADYGGHTTRERLFGIWRRDGQPIDWPKMVCAKKPAKGKKKWKPAADCIDFSDLGTSIFHRPKPLADATLRRIAKGMKRYVLDNPKPFIVPIAHYNGSNTAHSIDEPLRTITAATKGGEFSLASPVLVQAGHGEGKPGARRWSHGINDIQEPLGTVVASGGGHAIAAATLVQTGYGEREGQAPRALDIENPLGTVVAGACKHALATAYLMQANGGFNTTPGHDLDRPMSTVTNTGSQQQLVTAHLAHLRGNCDARDAAEPLRTVSAGGEHHGLVTAFLSRQFGASIGHPADEPMGTIMAGGGGKTALVECQLSQEDEAGALRVAAFLMRYYGEGGQWSDIGDPMATITTKDRLALVTVFIKGTPYVIVDIRLRMLKPRELYRAQDFPESYIIERGHDGRVFSKSAQVRMCGNSVNPIPAAAFLRANAPGLAVRRAA